MKLEPVNIVCPACGNANYMRHLIGKNVGHLNLKCINCNSYFNFDELYKRRIGEVLKRKPSNADRIRGMTDEELAEWIVHKTEGNGFDGYEISVKAWLDWLKQGVDDATD